MFRANAVRRDSFSCAITLCLSIGECPWTSASNSMLPELQPICYNNNSTIPHCFRGKIPKEAASDQDPTVAQGAGCLKSTCGCGNMWGPFLVNSLLSKRWTCSKGLRGCRMRCMIQSWCHGTRSWDSAVQTYGTLGKEGLSDCSTMNLQTAPFIESSIIPDIIVHDLEYRQSD